ncbi:RNA-binding ATPase activator esf2 [Mortierella hygrophila]|uniref:18S rRNA factor 2 n=1 Tax=Mortierella hygrophila TaxID=979708 RepID=A0A9P6FEQ1_9FUNG|nr:RNA-binding ATPase activator esf2 [Mortierella hygrophila]
MSAKVKADDIFNLEEADSDGSGYDSEEQQTTKKASSKKVIKTAATRKKSAAVFGLDQAGESDDEDDYSSQDENDDEEDNDKEDTTITASMDSRFKLTDDNNEDGEEEDSSKRVRGAKKTKKVKPLTLEELEKFQAVRDKTGIVYLSKIPPFMKPVKLRHLLGAFGELGRVYLAPEDSKVAARRKKYGGNKKQNFTEGWVEFKDKSIAKQVAKSLNATIIGGSKKSFYHDDMWNIKYLPKFKWDHLTERIAYENASRAQRLQAEINQAKRENKSILTNIEKAKMIKNMEEKKAAKRQASEMDSTPAASSTATAKSQVTTAEPKIRRSFKQRRLGESSESTSAAPAKPVSGKIKSVLGNVFGR